MRAICQDVSPSCADNFGLCGHCSPASPSSAEDNGRHGNDYGSFSSSHQNAEDDDDEDYEQPFESVRRIRNRPLAAMKNSSDNGTTVTNVGRGTVPNGTKTNFLNYYYSENISRRIKSNGEFSERVIIKIGGGHQKEQIELRAQNGETLRISREILAEETQPEKNRKGQKKKSRRNLSPLLLILEKVRPKETKEKQREEETLAQEESARAKKVLVFPEGGEQNGTEIVWTSAETKKDKNSVGEIAYGQRQEKKLGNKRESRERENMSEELRIEKERNWEQEEAREAKRKENNAGERNEGRKKGGMEEKERLIDNEKHRENQRQEDNERQRKNERQIDNERQRENERQIDNERQRENERQKDKERIQENERQIDKMVVEVADKTTDIRGRNRINREQLHDRQTPTAAEGRNNKIEDEAFSKGKSTFGIANGTKNQSTNNQNDQRKMITNERMEAIKQATDRKSDRTKSNPTEEVSSDEKTKNGRLFWTKIVPADLRVSSSNKPLTNSTDKESLPPADGPSLPIPPGGRPLSPKQPPTNEQKKGPDGAATRTKSGNSELSERILQLLKNLQIAKEAVANYGAGRRRRRRKRSMANIADREEGKKAAANGQKKSDQKNESQLADQQGQSLLPPEQRKAVGTLTGSDFRGRLPEEKPPDEKKAEKKGTEEQMKLDAEEIISELIGGEADKLEEEEEGILDELMEGAELKETEQQQIGDVSERMADELIDQLLIKSETDEAIEIAAVIRAILTEIDDKLFAETEKQPEIGEELQGAQKVPKLREDTVADDAGDDESKYANGGLTEVLDNEQLVLGDQRRPMLKEDANEDPIDQPLSDQHTMDNTFPVDDHDRSFPAFQNEPAESFQKAAKAPKLSDFDRQNDNDRGAYGRWSDQSQRFNRFRDNSEEFGPTQTDDQGRKTFDGVLRDRGGRAVRVEDLPGGISGALERVRLRYGFGNGTMEEMLANLLLDTERDIANGLKEILSELKKLKGSERQRKMPIPNKEDEEEKNERESRKSKIRANGGREKSESDEESEKDAEKSERVRKNRRETGRNRVTSGEEDRRRTISREDRRQNNGEKEKGPIDQQADRTLRQLLVKFLTENGNKKRLAASSSMEQNLRALSKKRDDRKAAVPTLDGLMALIEKQRKAMGRKKGKPAESDSEEKQKKKPKPKLLSTRDNNRQRRILTAVPTRPASSVPRRGPATTLVLPRHALLPSAAGGPTSSGGYRLIPIIGTQMPTAPGQGYDNSGQQQSNFLPPFPGNGGPTPVFPMPSSQLRQGQAVPAAQPQQMPLQTQKQTAAVGWQQPILVQLPQQIQQQQTQFGQQQNPSQQQQTQQQPQTAYVQQQPSHQVQAVSAPQPPPPQQQQQPQIVVQRPAQQPQQQILLPNPQQPQQNLVVVDASASAPAGAVPRAPLPLLQQPPRVSSPSSSSRGSYVILRNSAIGAGSAIVGPKCRDYYPYCEQIVPRGFCISEVYPLRMKREYCPQSCGLC